MFKLVIRIKNPEETNDVSPTIQVTVKKPNAAPYLIGCLLAATLEDWGGRPIRVFHPDNLRCPDIFANYPNNRCVKIFRAIV